MATFSILDSIVTPQNRFDSHCHLQLAEFDTDRDQVIANAKAAGLTKIVIPAIDYETAISAIAIAERDPQFFEVAVGNHPYNADQSTDQQMIQFQNLFDKHEVVTAVGETGLDYFRNKLDPQVQIESLTKHAQLAKANDSYLILHSRPLETTLDDLLKVLADQGNKKVIFHCFSGNLEQAKKIWNKGYKTGFGCNTTYTENAQLQAVMQSCPQELLLLETDSPYLPPATKRGERNEPKNLTQLSWPN